MQGNHYETWFDKDTTPANQVPETVGSNAGNQTAYQKKPISSVFTRYGNDWVREYSDGTADIGGEFFSGLLAPNNSQQVVITFPVAIKTLIRPNITIGNFASAAAAPSFVPQEAHVIFNTITANDVQVRAYNIEDLTSATGAFYYQMSGVELL